MKREKIEQHVPHGLCLRCQRRLDSIEKGWGYRLECSQWEITRRPDKTPSYFSSHSCYGFIPQQPIVLAKSYKKDPRPFPIGIIGSRGHAVRELTENKQRRLRAKRVKGGIVMYWEPK